MPDDANQAGTNAGEANDAQGAQGGQATAQAPTQEDIDRLTTALSKERDARKRAEALAKEAGSGKSDAERLAAERDALVKKVETLAAKARHANGKDAIHRAAKAAGAPDTDLIYRLVRADIDYDDDDEPVNIDELIAGARKEFPDLFKIKPGKADTGGEGAKGKLTKGVSMNDWIREKAGR